jgi:hypothetical protein
MPAYVDRKKFSLFTFLTNVRLQTTRPSLVLLILRFLFMSLGGIWQRIGSASAAASMALDLQISSLSPFQNEGILMPKESAVGVI